MENMEINELENEITKVVKKPWELMVAENVDFKIGQTEEEFLKKTSHVQSLIYKENNEMLKLIPKYTDYMEYMLELLRLLPRIEKFNLGNEYKTIMYQTFENIMFLDKIENKSKMYYLNKIDSGINIQRVFLRLMVKNKWISIEKFNTVMLEKIAEIGRIAGGLIKYHAQNNKK